MAIFNGTTGNDTINRSADLEADLINGLTGNDTLIGGSGDDTLNGGGGVDSLAGGAGNDIYYVSSVYDARSRYYIFDTILEDSGTSGGIDTVITNAKNYYLAANVENLVVTAGGGAHGNELDNFITGSGAVDAIEAFEGNDTILGGAGNDILAGGAGNDSIEGGDGDDHIWGDSDLLTEGWVGNDVLRGGAGNDEVKGGAGYDTLYGDGGNDTLVAGTGGSTLYGGDGDDTYYVSPDIYGFGGPDPIHADLVDETGTTGIDTIIVTAGVIPPSGKLARVVRMPDNVENMIVQFETIAVGNSQDNIITSYVARTPVEGAAGNDIITGSDYVDWLAGGDGSDTLIGNGGDDRLYGDGSWGGADEDQLLPGNDSIRGGAGNDEISGEGGSDRLFGDEGNDTIYGDDNVSDASNGNDTISGGAGDDTLIDASTFSNDVYAWGRDQGADNLSDSGGTDRLDVLPGVITNQLWLRHVGNNLEISVIGTSDKFTVNNWYGSAANQVESIKLSDGKTLAANKVDNLVNAMAAFTPPAAGQTTLPTNYQTALNPVIAANWA